MLWEFFKKETVLCVAVILAVLSALSVPPDAEYLGYIDFRTLSILFCLMTVMAGLQRLGVFRLIADRLLRLVHRPGQLVCVLVALCFVFSMAITNDVALITFVPFAFTVGRRLGQETYRRMVIPTVVLQTVAANLGSMLTPIGNPQNLYLYGLSGMGAGEFVLLMLPFTAASFVLLAVCCGICAVQMGKGEEMVSFSGNRNESSDVPKGQQTNVRLTVYLCLFALCLFTVARILPYGITLLVTIAAVCLVDRQTLKRVDYSLLLTFVGFFVFIGNMGRVSWFADSLGSAVAGNEVLVSVLASQCISNVPAALLLSGFTENVRGLIVGTNLGGLGTLIASMASLISYKYFAAESSSMRAEVPFPGKGQYLLWFTAVNVVFLVVLLGIAHFI